MAKGKGRRKGGKRRKGKKKGGTVPLKILEKRLGRLNAIVKKRGGSAY